MIQTAEQLFITQGIAQTKMDDIAQAVPVSKMTLYKYFESKERLTKEVLYHIMDRYQKELDIMFEKTKDDPLQFLSDVTAMQQQASEQLPNAFIEELIHLYPELSLELIQLQKESILPMFEEMIFQGQKQGKIRKDISPHVITLWLVSLKTFFSNPNNFEAGMDLHAIGQQFMTIFCYGIMAPDEIKNDKISKNM